jgi:hypothetical protein
MRIRHCLGVSRLFLGRLAALGLLAQALVLPLAGCGSGGDEFGSGTTNFGPGVSITSPTTDPTFSQVCDSEGLSGSAGIASFKCCNLSIEEATGVKVTWTNAATGTSGQAIQSVFCPIFPICSHLWSAFVPLVLGDNQITVTASNTTTGAASTDTITINKPILTYTVSGTFSSHLGVPPGKGSSKLGITRVGADGSQSVSILPSGSYGMSCVADGSYTLTPSSTINYDFSPANRNVTVAGADVIGQDFTATAFLISGSVTHASNGAGVEGQAISLSGSSSVATEFTRGGSYSFLVPNGTYTLTPTTSLGLPVQTSPPSRTVTVNNADVPAQDFVR